MKPKLLISIVGPTATGKTDISIFFAKKYQVEIVSTDARQVYKELDIGVAKPSYQQLKEVIHHFISHVEIHKNYSAGKFGREAKTVLSKSNLSISVGGSGLYSKAIWEGLDDMPLVDSKIRTELIEEFQKEGLMPLQTELQKKDPIYFDRVDTKNHQRIIRALEVIRATGLPFTHFRKNQSQSLPYDIIKIGIHKETEILYERINKRVDEMMEKGLLKEVESLAAYKNLNALQTVGYKELIEYFEGKHNLDTAVSLIKRNTRRYAKRQMAWYRRYNDIQWFAPERRGEIEKFLEEKINIKRKDA